MKSLTLIGIHVFFRRLFWVLLLLVSVLSLIPNPDDLPGGSLWAEFLAKIFFGSADHADKITHFIAYGVLAGGAGLGGLRLFSRRWLIIPGLILWSGALELLQGLTQSRDPDWLDMVANSAGVLAGFIASLGLLVLITGYMERRKQI